VQQRYEILKQDYC